VKKNLLLMVIIGFIVLGRTEVALAGEIDILLEKLVDKGVLTANEALIIKDETQQQVTKEVVESKSYALPKWVQNTKLKGDFRLRYQYERKSKELQSRTRGRIRYRLGLETKVNDEFKVAAGLASGEGDPRSTHMTFEDAFAQPDIRLDYAYLEYIPTEGIQLAGGRFLRANYLWEPTDMMWDTDINPEGGSAHFEKSLSDNVNGFLNTGVLVVDELDTGNKSIASDNSEKHPDPFMNYVQGGMSWSEGNLDGKMAAIYYGFHGVKGIDFPNDKNTNSKLNGFLIYDYDAFSLATEAGIKNPFDLPFERVAIFGEYIQNVDPKRFNDGWAAGFKFGNEKVSDRKQWQAKYQYVWLGKDAVLDIFPDSDRLSGATNVKSHEAIFEYGLSKNVSICLDYYLSDNIKNATKSTKEHLVQADLNLKF
jgi:hypothetical protein